MESLLIVVKDTYDNIALSFISGDRIGGVAGDGDDGWDIILELEL